jgi:hypothetical protein
MRDHPGFFGTPGGIDPIQICFKEYENLDEQSRVNAERRTIEMQKAFPSA